MICLSHKELQDNMIFSQQTKQFIINSNLMITILIIHTLDMIRTIKIQKFLNRRLLIGKDIYIKKGLFKYFMTIIFVFLDFNLNRLEG